MKSTHKEAWAIWVAFVVIQVLAVAAAIVWATVLYGWQILGIAALLMFSGFAGRMQTSALEIYQKKHLQYVMEKRGREAREKCGRRTEHDRETRTAKTANEWI